MKFKLREARFDATSAQKYSSAKTAMANANRARNKGATPKLYTSVNFGGGNNLDYGCGAPETVAVVDESFSDIAVIVNPSSHNFLILFIVRSSIWLFPSPPVVRLYPFSL